ncbi:PilZ domain-containing protein [Sulfurivirga sp.]|uniref:PilZ domain-containing protein n=1 Tax=Sulfurivirga sp. TaxID=2614236 RepID=UPI0025D13C78|nr:PilZ domain-containing protein [Sulfurivirga sp.]
MEEKRQSTRIETNRPVRIIGGNKEVKGRLVSLSLRGAAVESPLPARKGTRLRLVFDLPAKDRFAQLDLWAEVQHAAQHADKHLLGVHFTDLKPSDEEAIQGFIDYVNRLKSMSVRNRNTSAL